MGVSVQHTFDELSVEPTNYFTAQIVRVGAMMVGILASPFANADTIERIEPTGLGEASVTQVVATDTQLFVNTGEAVYHYDPDNNSLAEIVIPSPVIPESEVGAQWPYELRSDNEQLTIAARACGPVPSLGTLYAVCYYISWYLLPGQNNALQYPVTPRALGAGTSYTLFAANGYASRIISYDSPTLFPAQVYDLNGTGDPIDTSRSGRTSRYEMNAYFVAVDNTVYKIQSDPSTMSCELSALNTISDSFESLAFVSYRPDEPSSSRDPCKTVPEVVDGRLVYVQNNVLLDGFIDPTSPRYECKIVTYDPESSSLNAVTMPAGSQCSEPWVTGNTASILVTTNEVESVWSSDGTTTGTVETARVLPPAHYHRMFSAPGAPNFHRYVGDRRTLGTIESQTPVTYFKWENGIWRTDETITGTYQVKDQADMEIRGPQHTAINDGSLYFSAWSGSGSSTIRALYRVTPTALPEEQTRIITTPDREAPGNYGWIQYDDGTKHWVDAECRARLSEAGIGLAVLPWASIAAVADTASLSCDSVLERIGGQPNTFPLVLSTPDKPNNNDYGWVLYEDGNKHWISGECRTELAAAGAQSKLEEWTTIDAYRDRDPLSCEAIVNLLSGDTPTLPALVTTADRIASPNYGWFVFEDGSKQWVSRDCRSSIEAAGFSTTVMSWDDINAYPDTTPVSCERILGGASL